MQRVSPYRPRYFDPGNAVLPVAFLLAVAGFVMLATVASGHAYTSLDARVAGWVQGLSLPGFGFVSGVTNVLTDAPMAIALWLAAMTLLVLKGRPLDSIAIFLISGLWMANQLMGMVVDRPSISLEIGGVVELSRTESGSFPSGHVTGAVTFYGLLAFLLRAPGLPRLQQFATR